MKKFFSVFVIAAVVLGMASCGDGNDPEVARQVVELSVDKTELILKGAARTSDIFTVETNGSLNCTYDHDGDIESVSPISRGPTIPGRATQYVVEVTVPEVTNPPEAGTKDYCGKIHVNAYDPKFPNHFKRAEIVVYRQF